MVTSLFKLEKMDFTELLQLRDEVENALSGKIVIERRELHSKLAEMNKLAGRFKAPTAGSANKAAGRLSVSDGAKKTPVAPKYRGPQGETWAGRGLTPKWMTELEKKGKNRAQFLIAKA